MRRCFRVRRYAENDPQKRDPRRCGYTLVFFAMLMFALMGLAALVIDIGFARLTQRQMQTAVDSAAIEGLRFRDDPNVPEADRDESRRNRASDVVAMIFDDDLDPDNGDDGAFYDAANPDPHAGEQFNVDGQFGAGPILEFTDGVNDDDPVGDTKLAASKFIHSESNPNPNPKVGSYRATPFYKPVIQHNDGNENHGDLVAGNFLEDQATPDDEVEHDENADYVRSDFDLTEDSAFLARLRRTNDFRGLDNIAEESSSGPPVPYLFGRGSLLAFRDPTVTYSPRHHGMTVRATGIADARPVRSVGLPYESATPPLQGLARFALRLSYWNSLMTGTADQRSVSGGIITDVVADRGRFFNSGSIDLMPVVIGRTLPTAWTPDDGTYTGYVAIYESIPTGTGVDRIVGFGVATAQVASLGTEVTITRGANQTVAENSSGTVCYPVTLTEAQWGIVFDTNKSLYPSAIDDPTDSRFAGILLAPVSVR